MIKVHTDTAEQLLTRASESPLMSEQLNLVTAACFNLLSAIQQLEQENGA